MNTKWKKFKINDVCNVTDCQHKTAPTVDEYTGYKMIRTTNVRDGRLDIASMYNVTQETYDKWSIRGYLEEGDVILTREAPMGEVGIIRNEKEKLFLGQRTLQLKSNDNIHPQFLYYSLLSPALQTQIKREDNTGSTVSNIQIPVLKDMDITLPKLSEQISIADTLDFLNRKIEINDVINDNLAA